MIKDLVVDESISMSNLTSTSSETTGSLYHPHHNQFSSTSTNQQESQPRKKRSLPGHPDPDAEVIALSPKTLLAKNRFICEICKKGFQRDQNLQLHRRGHNLPWKLKQRNKEEIIKKKVYVCPESSCVHHDPLRALGDLTGIKKHFFRKHGEKKWKCEKCSKCYAVQSDWKAHSKICGTKEYKCDCGTIFSRRDSFITHRAFCDALSQESVIRSPNITTTTTTMVMNPLLLHHHTQNALLQSSSSSVKPELQDHHHHHYFLNNLRPQIQINNNPPWLASQPQGPPILPTQLDHTSNNTLIPNLLIPSNNSINSSHMSATALLQKASQIGSTMSSQNSLHTHHVLNHQGHVPNDDDGYCAKGYYSSSNFSTTMVPLSYGNKAAITDIDHHHHLESSNTPFHDVMMGGDDNCNNDSIIVEELVTKSTQSSQFSRINKGYATNGEGASGNYHEMTRDFLGLRSFSETDLYNISGIDHLGSSSSYEKQNHNNSPWQG